MLNNKKAISGIILTIIMIGLVLVAVGVVWVVISNLLQGESESISYDQKCLGIVFSVGTPVCSGSNCNVTIERSLGSGRDPIDGYEITVSNETDSDYDDFEDNIVGSVKKTFSIVNADKAELVIYLLKEDGTKHYCGQTFSSK